MQVPLTTGAYTGRSKDSAYEQLINLYPEKVETEQGKVKYILVGTPGTAPAFPAVALTGVCRGMYTASTGTLYAVVGDGLYIIPDVELQPAIKIGTIINGASSVNMVDDGRYLSIADGSELYVLTMATPELGFATPLNSIARPNSVAFIGGHTLCNNTWKDPAVAFPPTNNLVYYSELYNSTNWSATGVGANFFSAEGNVDAVVNIKRTGDSIFLFGSRSYEVHMLSGNDDKPFSRVGGSLTDIGCYAYASPAVIGENVFWLGITAHGGLSVYMNQGYDAVRISNSGLEYILGTIDCSDAIGWTYEQEGHRFYILTMRGTGFTYAYDMSTASWFRIASRIKNTDTYTVWEPIFATSRGSTTYVGSNLTSDIMKLSSLYYTESDGRPIKREWTYPFIWNDLLNVRHVTFEVMMECGVGLVDNNADGYNPQIMMTYSDNGARTWSIERTKPIGKVGEYKNRVRWNRLGMSRSRKYRCVITEPVKVIVLGASVQSDGASIKQ